MKLLWDFNIQTGKLTQARGPRESQCFITDVATHADTEAVEKEREKSRNIPRPTKGSRKVMEYKDNRGPVVGGAPGTVTRNLINHLATIGVTIKIELHSEGGSPCYRATSKKST